MRHGIDPYSTNLTPIGAQLGLETNWLVHASETPPFLLCFEPLTRMRPRVAFWLWTAINFSALAIAMYLLLVRRSGLSGRTALLLAGLDADVGTGESEFLLGTISVDSAGPDGRCDARDGARPRRHCRFADRGGGSFARIPASARRLFRDSSKVARGNFRNGRNRSRGICNGRDFGFVADPQLCSRRIVAHRLQSSEPGGQSFTRTVRLANVLGAHRYRARLIRRLDETRRYGHRGRSSTRTDYSRNAGNIRIDTIQIGESTHCGSRPQSCSRPSDGTTTWCYWLFRLCRWSHRRPRVVQARERSGWRR